MDPNVVAVVSVSVTGALAAAQLFTGWRTSVATRRHQREMSTLEWNRADLRDAHAVLYRELTRYVVISQTPPIHGREQGPEGWETWQKFSPALADVQLLASPAAAAAAERAVDAICTMAEYGTDDSPRAVEAFQQAEKAMAEYRATIRRDRGLDEAASLGGRAR